MLFDEQIKFIESLNVMILTTFEETINEYSEVLKGYIIDKQLYTKGIDGNNKKLKGYSRFTIQIKKSKQQPVDRTTLKDSGDFYISIRVEAFDDRFEISSNVPYDSDLVEKYGRDILKISSENMAEFINTHYLSNLKRKLK